MKADSIESEWICFSLSAQECLSVSSLDGRASSLTGVRPVPC